MPQVSECTCRREWAFEYIAGQLNQPSVREHTPLCKRSAAYRQGHQHLFVHYTFFCGLQGEWNKPTLTLQWKGGRGFKPLPTLTLSANEAKASEPKRCLRYWKDDSALKKQYCSSRGSKFSLQGWHWATDNCWNFSSRAPDAFLLKVPVFICTFPLTGTLWDV